MRFAARLFIFALLLSGAAAAVSLAPDAVFAADSGPDSTAAPARYRVRLREGMPPVLEVSAVLPCKGAVLEMARSRPADIEQLGREGWPALVRNLKVEDAAGGTVGLEPDGPAGWRLKDPVDGPLTVAYEVDYSLIASHGWPAPREGGFADADHFVTTGRPVFVSTPEVGSGVVEFELPPGWHAVTPWQSSEKDDPPPKADRSPEGSSGPSSGGDSPEGNRRFHVPARPDLVDNLLVFSRTRPDTVTADRFRLLITPLGHWEPVRQEVRRALRPAIASFAGIFGGKEREGYLVVLLPMPEDGGESFRNSFALTRESSPTAGNRADWANTIAHEVFHYWNGWRLRGEDYPTTQWFQEGFTEYFANLSLVAGGIVGPDEFLRKLTDHLRRSGELTTSLEGGGSSKGPPLYGGGAMVAFSWDVLIRDITGGKRNLADFLRALWERTGRGESTYTWADIQESLEATATGDWAGFYRAHIRGTEPLPLRTILPRAGLRPGPSEGGSPGSRRIEVDPSAPSGARSLWQALIAGR